MLENSVIRTCDAFLASSGGREVGRSETDPGVWMLKDHREGGGVSERKICAVGVQVTRGVGYFGVGLNVRDERIAEGERERMRFDDALEVPGNSRGTHEASVGAGADNTPPGYLSWGFNRIVACGLEGKSTTWLTREGAAEQTTSVAAVAERLAAELVVGLNQMGNGKERVQDVQTLVVGERELEGIEEGAMDVRELLAG
jgi:hypothetical protein